jgi:hypothetical protein
MKTEKEKTVTCALCGYKFEPCGQNCTNGCPFYKQCNLLRCPHCGYQTINDEKIREKIRKIGRAFQWLGKRAKKKF